MLLNDLAIMTLSPHGAPPRKPLGGTFSLWLAELLGSERILEFVSGQRWVIAKVPSIVGKGGRWLESNGVMKSVVVDADTSRFLAVADLVGGSAALGSVAALGPAMIGALAGAASYYRIVSALDRIQHDLGALQDRTRHADLGAVLGGRRFIGELDEWGPPHRWPQQLRYELAARRVALDPVCSSLQQEVTQVLAQVQDWSDSALKRASTEPSNRMVDTVDHYVEATMVKAQIDTATAMVLLDCEAPPFGLGRLAMRAAEFSRDIDRVFGAIEAATLGEEPARIRVRARRHYQGLTETAARKVEELRAISEDAKGEGPAEVVLYCDGDGVRFGVPGEELGSSAT